MREHEPHDVHISAAWKAEDNRIGHIAALPSLFLLIMRNGRRSSLPERLGGLSQSVAARKTDVLEQAIIRLGQFAKRAALAASCRPHSDRRQPAGRHR